ncbi:ABC transporter substrate-binding protein [Nitrospinota bacterium]
MTKKKRCILALLLATVFLWMAGPATAAPKGKLIFGVSNPPTTLDPHTYYHMALTLVFDTLVEFDYEGKIVPHFAESFRQAEPTVWEFKLRQGVKFTNGEPADAHAVKYSMERILDPKLKTRIFAHFRTVDRAEVVDTYTVRIHTKVPDSFLISAFAVYGPHIVPPKYYASHDAKYLARHPVGSGPYKLVKWSKGEELVFEANPGYWNPSKQRVKTGIIKNIPEPTTRVSALVSGGVDMIDGVPPQLVSMIQKNPATEIVPWHAPRTCYLIMNIKEGAPWADVRVRKALNYAIDKDAIIKNIIRGLARKVAMNVGPTSYGHNPDLKPYPFDPKKAKKLLAEAGYANGFEVDMFVPLGKYLLGKQTAEAIGGELAKIGLKVSVRPVEWGNLVKRMRPRWEPHSKPFWWYSCRLDRLLHAEGMYSGAIHSRSNWGGFRDKELDKMLEAARAETDPAKRLKMYRENNRVIYEEKVPLVFLWQLNQTNAKKKSVDWKMLPNALSFFTEAGWKD